METTVGVAVAAANFAIDRLYTYTVPEQFVNKAVPGVRVTAPFSRGNRETEGFIFEVGESDDTATLKPITNVLDSAPVLSARNLKLAKWMKSHFFCSLYEAGRAMLPSGLWTLSGDKTVIYAILAVSPEQALEYVAARARRAPQQAEILRLLLDFGEAPMKEIAYFTGAGTGSFKALVRNGLIKLEHKEVFRRPPIPSSAGQPITALTAEQQEAYEVFKALMETGEAKAGLLYGVTGSGKTAVYIRLIAYAIKKGKKAVALVPEISLTPQLVATMRRNFGERVAVLHSSLSTGERFDEWKRIKSGLVDVVVGTRSAVFAPLENLGLIIIDEEQEHTYKSEMNPRYHARDVAKYLCSVDNALLLLASATPAVESMYYALNGKYTLYTLKERYNRRQLPKVIIADMKRELKNGNGGSLSSVLISELEKNIESGEQAILFINRRGTNSIVSCPDCGFMYECPRCSVHLTYHGANKRMMCHYCGYSTTAENNCFKCGGILRFIGAGTQKIEQELIERFPDVRVLRMDADTVGAHHSHEAILNDFETNKVPVLLGTQMVTKGLDFDNVTLVGVLSADQALYSGDWRAQENTFSLITQVVGRSGRGEKTGRAVIQTFTPDNETIKCAAEQDYGAFYNREIKLRRILGSPPIADLYALFASGEDEERVVECCRELKSALEASVEGRDGFRVLGPAPASVLRVMGRYRYRVFLSSPPDPLARALIAGAIRKYRGRFKDVAIFGDVDPLD